MKAMADVVKARKGASVAQQLDVLGAELVDSEPISGARRFRLLNGIPVLMKRRRSGKMALPDGPPGRAMIQFVSLGGRATQTPGLKGACEFVNAAQDYVDAYSTSYNDGGNSTDDVDYFAAETFTAMLRSVTKSADANRGGPGSPGKVELRCESEYMVVQAELSMGCRVSLVQDRIPDPGGLAEARRCNASYMFQMGPLAQLSRLAMQPHYSERAVHLVADSNDEKRCSSQRAPKPRDTMKKHSLQYVLPGLVRTKGLGSAPDHRLVMPTPDDVRSLDPTEVRSTTRTQCVFNCAHARLHTYRFRTDRRYSTQDMNFRLSWLVWLWRSTPCSQQHRILTHTMFLLWCICYPSFLCFGRHIARLAIMSNPIISSFVVVGCQVSAWVHEQFSTDRMEINIVGDFDEAVVLRELNVRRRQL